MIFYPVFMKPARGFVYRRRSDGVLARVDCYAKFPGVRLSDRAGNVYWETRESFWDRWLHDDLYDTQRN